MKIYIALFCGILLTVQSCKTRDKSPKLEVANNKTASAPNRNIKLIREGYTYGVITDKTGLDGCTYVIYGDSNRVFEPFNLEENYKKDGLKVYFKYRLSRMASICQHGQPITISDIKLAE